ncbi:uncharacterized protein L201_003442 [Kwoniella dendrophila CBS 6074]|uniref:NADH:ubiquinone oxidoreductase intermediate-associated protein 30 domain-containing protein n=1 Tax=Kwoniella dendrophila CBS 6074 TaxID=1295534 RepID=A0AAX4JSW7_9TREE
MSQDTYTFHPSLANGKYDSEAATLNDVMGTDTILVVPSSQQRVADETNARTFSIQGEIRDVTNINHPREIGSLFFGKLDGSPKIGKFRKVDKAFPRDAYMDSYFEYGAKSACERLGRLNSTIKQRMSSSYTYSVSSMITSMDLKKFNVPTNAKATLTFDQVQCDRHLDYMYYKEISQMRETCKFVKSAGSGDMIRKYPDNVTFIGLTGNLSWDGGSRDVEFNFTLQDEISKAPTGSEYA